MGCCFLGNFCLKVVNETWGSSGKRVKDYSLYTGALGTAFLLFRAFQITRNESDLRLCSQIVNACDSASDSGYYVFLLAVNCMSICFFCLVIVPFYESNLLNNKNLCSFSELCVLFDS